MKTIKETIIETLEIVNEEWFLNNYKGETLFIRFDTFGYLIGARGKEFFDKKGNRISTFEITDICRTKKETIEMVKQKMNL